jgi:hypothetical protein
MSRHSLLALIAFTLFLTSFAVVPAFTQITFGAAGYSSGDYDTASIVSGDFNNDGILDLVTINATTISFYKGIGEGKYAAAQTQNLNLFYRSQALIADFNRDGKLDIAIGCNSCSFGTPLAILLGNGDGTFTVGEGIPNNISDYYIAAADFNGDHIPDIAISGCDSSNNCSIQVFLGKGDGTFTPSASLPYGGDQVVTGDFNADGHQDLAVLTAVLTSSSTSQLAVFLGNGNGTFQNALLTNLPNAVGLAVGDFYNDRIQSLALLTYGSNETDYVSTARYANGAFLLSTPQLVTGPFFYIAAGDLNGDFLDDVVLTGGVFTCDKCIEPLTRYMLGNGNGTFQSPVKAPAYGQYGDFPFVRDLNRDSRHDIGIAWDAPYEEEGGGAFVLLNNNAIVNCPPPKANALSVNICAPTKGETVPSTFTFKGSGNAFDGIAKRMELWIDNKKIGQNLEDQLNVTTTLSPGAHTASFVVVDSFDNYTSQAVTFTAQ